MLYLSLYFKTHRQEYYSYLQKVRTEGDWEGWLRFFLVGVRETADQAVTTARTILKLFEEDRQRIEKLGRAASSPIRIHQALQRNPLLSIPKAAQITGLSYPTVASGLQKLEEIGMVKEFTGKARDRVYLYGKYISVLSEGAEPIKPQE
jgi:Fic family protein